MFNCNDFCGKFKIPVLRLFYLNIDIAKKQKNSPYVSVWDVRHPT